MTRRALSFLAVLFGSVTVGTSPDAHQAIFRSAVDSVAVDVAVYSGNTPVSNLTARDFMVSDNGVTQAIVDLSYETSPVDVTLVIDASGSVQGPVLEALRRSVRGITTRLRKDDSVRVVTFGDRIQEHARTVVDEAIGDALRAPTGQTSLLNALAFSLITEPSASRRQMVLVFTDGHDTVSMIDEATILAIARRADPAIFTVAVAPGYTRFPRAAAHEKMFEALAELTGGRLTTLQRDQDLGGSFVKAFDDFRTSYVLRYTVTGVARDGWHEIVVRVTRPGDYSVRARKGYVRGAAPAPR